MQGFYKGKKDGHIPEWPAPEQSTMTWRGTPVPYAPYDLSDEDYYKFTYGSFTIKHRELCSLPLFQHVERTPLPEEAMIKVENIRGKIVVFGAEDDTMWFAADYIRRMGKRLKEKGFTYDYEPHIYKWGTHFVFPEGMLKCILPIGYNLMSRLFISGRKHPKECRKTRLDIEKATINAIQNW